ncbi:MAG: hypothetical protein VR67_03250 [Peptococcaceae bacterium BRH_c8a]|nr:MAG: hypothetical protein VR67_03250 [Peptococcaceae bacterium BRH_c8a]
MVKMEYLNLFKVKIEKWLLANPNKTELKKHLNKVAFILIIAAYLLPAPVWLSELLFWLAILIAIFGTFLNYKYK